MAQHRRPAVAVVVYLYPSDFLALVSCEKGPLRWSIYFYGRAGEIKALTSAEIDLEHGVVHIHEAIDRNTGDAGKTKTRKTRRVPIAPNVAPLLRAFIDEVGDGGTPLRLDGDRQEALTPGAGAAMPGPRRH